MIVIGLIAFAMPAALSTSAADAASANVTSFRYVSFPGDFVGGGRQQSYSQANATLTASGTAGGVLVVVTTPTEDWSGSFTPRFGTRLHPGWFPNGLRFPDSYHPGLDFGGDSRGCNEDFGGISIYSIQFNTDGNLTELSMSFVQHCESSTAPPLVGWFNFNAPASAPVTLVAQDPSVVPGEPIVLGARVVGSSTPPTGSVTFVDGTTTIGTSAVDFLGLAHITLPTLDAGTHHIHADYSGDSNYSAGTSDPVTQVVAAPTSSLWFASTAGDFVARGAMASFTPPNVGVSGGAHNIRVFAGQASWLIDLVAPAGDNFKVGTTYSTTQIVHGSRAAIDFDGDGRGCNREYGTFVIHRIHVNTAGQLTSLDASFVAHCGDVAPSPPVNGEIVLNG